jgi:hypothetical protein
VSHPWRTLTTCAICVTALRSRLRRVAAIPKLVVVGDHDQLVPEQISSTAAESLGTRHVTVGRDWPLRGFGHIIPIGTGSEAVRKLC